ncbi:MAG TPA: AAA family ATPase [Myxococcota bacterium]|nr:AAA family ATPase [Myxococcota bacterium]HQK51473.1 AAA family ATPase [Myxococcota bacterium]
MSQPDAIDPITQEIVAWAKRAARAAGRSRMTPEDVLCGLYARRDLESVSRAVASAMGVSPKDIRWPEDLEEVRTRASQVPEVTEKMGMDETLAKAVDQAYRVSSQLLHDVLIRTLMSQSLPLQGRFQNARSDPKGPLLARLQETLSRAEMLAGRLGQVVLGQDQAIRMLVDAWFRATLTASSQGPRGIFTFLGPPGVGKTLLAETFAQVLGDVEGQPWGYRRFDMSTLSGPQNHEQLFGAERFYQGSRPGTLTGFVAEHPRSVILFDEIEKAHDLTILSLLALLDKGEVVDKALEKPISFRETFLVFTTNLGREFFEEANQSGILGGMSGDPAMVFDILQSARRFGAPGAGQEGGEGRPALAPEFVSRLAKGGAVVFNRLELHHLLQLVRQSMDRVLGNAREGSETPLLPRVHASDAATFLFLASMLPTLDARRTVARAESFAIEMVKRSFEECGEDLIRAAPTRYDIHLDASPQARGMLEKLEREQELRVLVVDEDPRLPPLVESLASGFPLTVRQVGKAEEVETELRRFRPDVAFLDLSLAERDDSPEVEAGLRALEVLRRAASQVPVYLFSEDPERRDGFDRTLRRVLQRGGARAFLPLHLKDPNPMRQEDARARLAEVLVEVRRSRVVQVLRRSHKTLSFETRYRWDPENARIDATLDDLRKSVVLDAETQTARVRFSGIPRETFAQVVGLTRAKRRLAQVVQWLRNPGTLAAFGLRPPRGFLLAGPPGTGKTLLARALAGEAGVPFLSLSASEMISKWIGESEERIRDLFRQARDYAPAIIFLDEIDSIARARTGESRSWETSTLNQLLASMDGFQASDQTVFVLAATNHPDVLDPALLRPGRFDEVVPVDLPDREARRVFFEMRLRELGVTDVDLEPLVEGTVGCSPAQMDRMVREAGYAVAAAGRDRITLEDLQAARRLVRFGAAREGFVQREGEKRLTAWHEAGHALVHMRRMDGRRIDLLTIVPTEAGALGYMAPLADEESHDLTCDEVRARIEVALAGREAERICLAGDFSQVTAGAISDLEHATRLAFSAVTRFGFDDRFGPLSLDGLPPAATKDAMTLAQERTREWLAEGETAARALLEREKPLLEALAKALLQRETLEWPQIREVMAPFEAGAPPPARSD